MYDNKERESCAHTRRADLSGEHVGIWHRHCQKILSIHPRLEHKESSTITDTTSHGIAYEYPKSRLAKSLSHRLYDCVHIHGWNQLKSVVH
jgi:hypothetical protein